MNVTPADPDEVIHAKLGRAMDVLGELKTMQAELRDQRTDPEYTRESNATDHSSPTVWIEWRLKSAPPALPLTFSALLGDVVHNLRASLDYSAWAAAAEQERKQNPRSISFPLHDKEAAFDKWKKNNRRCYPQHTMEVIAWAQPFHASPDQHHPLRILQQLSNTDKHRLLHTVWFARAADPTITITPSPPIQRVTTSRDQPQVGDTLLRVEFPRSPVSRDIVTRPTFFWYESIPYTNPEGDINWLRIDEMLNAICKFTLTTLEQMSGARGLDHAT